MVFLKGSTLFFFSDGRRVINWFARDVTVIYRIRFHFQDFMHFDGTPCCKADQGNISPKAKSGLTCANITMSGNEQNATTRKEIAPKYFIIPPFVPPVKIQASVSSAICISWLRTDSNSPDIWKSTAPPVIPTSSFGRGRFHTDSTK